MCIRDSISTYLVCLIYAWEYMLLQAGFAVRTWDQFDLRMKLDAWATINKQSSASTFTAPTSDEIEKKWNSILSIIEVGNVHNLGAWHRYKYILLFPHTLSPRPKYVLFSMYRHKQV